MDKTAFIFPGQGAQCVGMGKDFYKNYPAAKMIYEEANDILDSNIAKICFEGPEKELLLTKNTQPGIFTTSVAILRVLQQKGFPCDYTAGLSLGEYSALVNAESIGFSETVKLVQNRGLYMQQVVPNGVGKMGAVIGLARDRVVHVLEHAQKIGVIQVANYNTPEQIVLSGETKAVKSAMKKSKELGARRALILPVSAPFHCSLLEPAGELLKKDLDKVDFKEPRIPVVSNVDAEIITNKDHICLALIRQVSSSVLWQQSMELLLNKGVKKFIEIGPGTTLGNFVRAIAAHLHIEVRSESVGDIEGFKRAEKILY